MNEQETLLREIHHRVNNNMQIISSMLSLQSTQVKDPSDLLLFKDSQNRVKSMAKVHERLYQSYDLSTIKFADYCKSLLTDLFSSHRAPPSVRLKLDIENVPFNMETAIPCGLLINELVSNSLKYAFPDKNGEIAVSLKHYNQNQYLLTISDNGIGIPDDIDFENGPSLGFRLVHNLTNQLEGKIELFKTGGTTFKLLFMELVYETRSGIKDTITTAYRSRELRETAERIVNNRIDDIEAIPQDYHELLQDLQVHQIEVEMQKEELKTSKREILESRKKYLDLYNSSPVGYLSIGKDCIIKEINDTGASMLGISLGGLINTSFLSFLRSDSRLIFENYNDKAIKTWKKQKYRMALLRAEGNEFDAYVEVTPVINSDGTFKEFQMTLIDFSRF